MIERWNNFSGRWWGWPDVVAALIFSFGIAVLFTRWEKKEARNG